MTTRILYGKPVADSLREDILKRASKLSVKPKLALLGFAEEKWKQYCSSLLKSAPLYGFSAEEFTLAENASPSDFGCLLEKVSKDGSIQAVLCQQPLHESFAAVIGKIAPEKDVDCLSYQNCALLLKNLSGIRPATPSAVIALFNFYGIKTAGKNVVVIGRGNSVGRPLSLMLTDSNATVTLCHTQTKNLASIAKEADIIVSACGSAGLINADFVNKNSIVADVGLSFTDGKMSGDIDFDGLNGKCAALTPVPGGIGPITRACLFLNAVTAAEKLV